MAGQEDWEVLSPEETGALTAAPLLAYRPRRDSDGLLWNAPVIYKFERYAVEDEVNTWKTGDPGGGIYLSKNTAILASWDTEHYRVFVTAHGPSSALYDIALYDLRWDSTHPCLVIPAHSIVGSRPITDPWHLNSLLIYLMATDLSEIVRRLSGRQRAISERWITIQPFLVLSYMQTAFAPLHDQLQERWTYTYTISGDQITLYIYERRVEVWAFDRLIYTLTAARSKRVGITLDPLRAGCEALTLADALLEALAYTVGGQTSEEDALDSIGMVPADVTDGARIAMGSYIHRMDVLCIGLEIEEQMHQDPDYVVNPILPESVSQRVRAWMRENGWTIDIF
jgi:hypothetical protein